MSTNSKLANKNSGKLTIFCNYTIFLNRKENDSWSGRTSVTKPSKTEGGFLFHSPSSCLHFRSAVLAICYLLSIRIAIHCTILKTHYPQMATMVEDGDRTCPICAEEMDLTDLQLKPCKCGYDICVWCWHQILGRAEKDGSEGRCPACRTIYDKEKIIATDNSKRILPEEKRQKSQRTRSKTYSTIEDRKQLTNVRVVQKNLVYVMGMPSNLADEKILESKEYFGQYGKVLKVSISRQPGITPQHASMNDTFNVYISYAREDEAVRCIQSVHNFVLEDRPLRACFGTTKYCYIWLRNMVCNNPDCLYLHEIGSEEESFTKDEIISAYTRSRVPPIPSNCLQSRAGDVLPPPVDDLHNGIMLTTNPPIKNSNNKNINQLKSLPVDANSTRSTVLPAAASWGSRASNCHPSTSVANLQSPTKQKIELANGISNSSMPKDNSVFREDKSRINESIKNNSGSSSYCEIQDVEHNLTSAWEDDTPSESISDRSQMVYACGVSKNISPISGPRGEVSSEESRCSEWDNGTFLNSNMNRETESVGNDENIRPVETANKDSMACESINSSVDELNHVSSPSNENNVSGHVGLDNHSEMNLMELPPQKSTYINHQLAENFGIQNYSGNEVRCLTSLPESNTPTIHGTHVLSPSISCDHLVTSRNGEAVDKLFSVDGDSSIRWDNRDSDPSYFTGISKSSINCTKNEPCLSDFDNSLYINRNGNANRGEEESIVSKVLSSDFDPWDNSWSKLLAEMNINHGATSKQSTSIKVQDANQSRFSFARQDNFQPTPGFGQRSVFPKQEPSYENFRDTALISNLERANVLENNGSIISSYATPGTTKTKIPPPGFALTNHRTPPGFSSPSRYDQAINTFSDPQSLNNHLQNQFQVPLTNTAADVEFIDPAILAVGKRRMPFELNNANGLTSRSSTFNPHVNTTDIDARRQILMQQSISNHASRNLNQFDNRFLHIDDAYTNSRYSLHNQDPSLLSHVSQQQPSFNLNNLSSQTQWNSWSDTQLTNGINGRLSLSNYFHANEEPKHHISSSGDFYSRSFGL